jgi:hypothetical protein
VAQSLQLRAAWGTPCVHLGARGWPLYLWIGRTEWGVHYWSGEPYAFVYTDGLPYIASSQAFSHEVIEALVEPTTTSAAHRREYR